MVANTIEVDGIRHGATRMREFVDSGRWRDAPWYEGTFTEHFVQSLPNCRLFVDVGAEIGYYSLWR